MKDTIKKFKRFISFHIGVIRELWKITPGKTLYLILFSVFLPLSSLIELWFTKYLTNSIAYYDFSNNKVFSHTILMLIGIALSLIIFVFLNWVFNIVNNKYANDIVSKKQSEFLNVISQISYENFESAEFYHNLCVANDAPGQYAAAISHITAMLNTIVYLIIYYIVICRINFFLIFLLIASFCLYIWMNKKIYGKWDYYYDDYIIPERRKSNYFESILSNRVNHYTIQVNRQLPFFMKKYEEHADNERKYTLKLNLLSFFSEIVMAILFLFIFLFILLLVSKKIVKGVYEIGEFTLISSVMFRLFALYRNLTHYIFAEKLHIKTIRIFKEIMEFTENSGTHKKNNSDEKDNVTINHLTYKYKQAQNYALQDINYTFKRGEKIAIVGENGSGKTTLILILLNLLQKTDGELINFLGKPTAIMQDFQFYQFTIKENIELGCKGKCLEEERINDILKKVQLFDFINELPNGMYTKIGQLEDGIELSKGQFQRLALARMLADDEAKIWILDEPTAYLDPIAEIDMYQYILKLSGDKLVFFISHRLGFAKNADKILVLHNGKIEEAGTHEELMKMTNGLYKEMYESQLEWYK